MAERAVSASEQEFFGASGTLYTWIGLLNGDTGSPVQVGYGEICAQFVGTFGSGGTIVLKGSNDGTNYVALTDPQGNAISKTSASLEAVEEKPQYIRPEATAGDGTTDLKCYLFVRRPT